MTVEKLYELVLLRDPGELAAALAPLDEKARRRLAKPAAKLHRQLDRGEKIEVPAALVKPVRRAKIEFFGSAWCTSGLAVLGTGTLAQARRIGSGYLRDEYEQAALKILTDRRPKWIDAWIEHILDQDFILVSWPLVRTLVRDGLCRRPESDGYVRLMAQDLRQWHAGQGKAHPPLSRRLLEDPELLEVEVWQLFEVETGAFSGDTVKNPYAPDDAESWTDALVRLAGEGHVDRDRLLDASLTALTSGLPPASLSGFHRLHQRLKPTAGEQAARQAAYRDLLASPVAHVAGFGLTMLGRLAKSGRVDLARCLEELEAVFALPVKGVPLRALRLARRLAGKEPDLWPLAARAAAGALAHSDKDVQTFGLETLEASPELDAETHSRIAGQVDFLSAALRQRARALVNAPADRTEASPDPVLEGNDHGTNLATLRRRVRALDPELRRRCGLEGAERDGAGYPPPFAADVSQVPQLPSAEPIEPIADLEELIDAVAHALEQIDSPDELERILDGVSRLCGRRPKDFERRTEALVKRLESPEGASDRGLAGSFFGWAAPLRELLLVWLTGRAGQGQWVNYAEITDLPRFIDARVKAVAERALARRAAPTLAAPTHAGGWIDPRVLISRAAALGKNAVPEDLAQALLRLAPDHRDQALAAAGAVEGVAGRLLRFTLGGDGPTSGDRKRAWLWLIAGRARAPRGDLRDVLAPLASDLAGLGPDALEPASWTWRAHLRESRVQGQTYRFPELDLTVSPPVPDPSPGGASSLAGVGRSLADAVAVLWTGERRRRPRSFELPTVALHRQERGPWFTGEHVAEWSVRWAGWIWPQAADSHFASGVRKLMRRIDDPPAAMAPNCGYLEPLFEIDRPWSEMAYLLVCVALVSRDGDARGTAVDALIEAAGDGRAHPQPLAETLVRLAAGGWIKLNRLSEALAQVAEISPVHEHLVAGVLEPLVAAWDKVPRGAHHVHELLLEVMALQGRAPGEAARQALVRVRGGGKTARLARELLKLEPVPDSPRRRRAVVQALEARLERAERWKRG